jgi:hypothetical protein
MQTQIKVRLKADLTQYHPGLTPGVEGYTIGVYGEWSRNFDRFIGVCFPGIHTLDVTWDSLEIIDAEYLERLAKERQEKMDPLKAARNVVKRVGPRGGFRYLTYEYTDKTSVNVYASTGSRSEAKELEKFFSEHGIPVKIEVEK